MSEAVSGREHSPPLDAPAPGRWRRMDLVAGLGLLGLLIFVQMVLAAAGKRPDRLLGLEAEVYRFFPTVLTGYAVLWLARVRGFTLSDLGFNRRRILMPAFLAWLVGVASGPLFLELLSLAAVRPAALGLFYVPTLALLGAGMVVVAPVVEEITFRGLLFRGLRQRWPLLPAAFLSGFVFAAFHLHALSLLPLTVTGMAFAWAYDRTGSIWAAILPHAGMNALALLALLVNP